MVKTIASIGLALSIALLPIAASAQGSRPGGHATFLDIFPRDQMTCGRTGWRFPGLINGHVPLYACVLRYRGNRGSSPFGPL